MLVFGTVIATKPHQVKIKIHDKDEFESDWYFVPQMCTKNDQSSNSIDLDTEVAACVSNDLQDGCIIGALYNDKDICIIQDKDVKLISFSDGSIFKYDKSTHCLDCTIQGCTTIKADSVNIDTPNLTVTGNITASGEVSDLTGTISQVRSTYNSHKHPNGNNGADTGTPSEVM